MHALVFKAAAAVVASGAVATGGASQIHSGQAQTKTVYVYVVKPGDTLWHIAAEFCGDGHDYRSLAAASDIPNPRVIKVGKTVILDCNGATPAPAQIQQPASKPAKSAPKRPAKPKVHVQTASNSGSSSANGQAAVPGTTIAVYSPSGLGALWLGAGGSSATEAVAVCIAEHESRGRTFAISPTNDWGLWQIHNGGASMLNPYNNAVEAVILSDNGRNWSKWTTHSACGV